MRTQHLMHLNNKSTLVRLNRAMCSIYRVKKSIFITGSHTFKDGKGRSFIVFVCFLLIFPNYNFLGRLLEHLQ